MRVGSSTSPSKTGHQNNALAILFVASGTLVGFVEQLEQLFARALWNDNSSPPLALDDCQLLPPEKIGVQFILLTGQAFRPTRQYKYRRGFHLSLRAP